MTKPQEKVCPTILVYLLLSVIVGGNLFCLVLRKEIWPFSDYPMYSHPMRNKWQHCDLYGVSELGGSGELLINRAALPLYVYRLPGLARLVARAENNSGWDPMAKERVRNVLRSLGSIYNARIESGQWDGPPIVALKLYRSTFERDIEVEGYKLEMIERVLIDEVEIQTP